MPRICLVKDGTGRTRYDEWKRKKIVGGADHQSFNPFDLVLLSASYKIIFDDTRYPMSREETELMNNPWAGE